MKRRSMSVAEARSNLPQLVDEAEHGRPVEITRRGHPVAVLVSASDYGRLAEGRQPFWQAVADFRERLDVDQYGLGASDLGGLRDRSPGRDVDL